MLSHINVCVGKYVSICELDEIIKEATSFTSEPKFYSSKPYGMPKKPAGCNAVGAVRLEKDGLNLKIG